MRRTTYSRLMNKISETRRDDLLASHIWRLFPGMI